MQHITKQEIEKESYFLFIHSPFCGTCHLARSMLNQIETIHKQSIFFEMNASIHPEFMQTHQIESVPCLFIKKDNKVVEKIYAFHSIPNIYHYLVKYDTELFSELDK